MKQKLFLPKQNGIDKICCKISRFHCNSKQNANNSCIQRVPELVCNSSPIFRYHHSPGHCLSIPLLYARAHNNPLTVDNRLSTHYTQLTLKCNIIIVNVLHVSGALNKWIENALVVHKCGNRAHYWSLVICLRRANI